MAKLVASSAIGSYLRSHLRRVAGQLELVRDLADRDAVMSAMAELLLERARLQGQLDNQTIRNLRGTIDRLESEAAGRIDGNDFKPILWPMLSGATSAASGFAEPPRDKAELSAGKPVKDKT